MAEPMVLSKLRPYYGRIAVLESPVDELERPSGLIVPLDEGDDETRRGVIIRIDYVDDTEDTEYVRERLREGTVVYFTGGITISDIIFLQSSQIIAYEEE
jgi:co-chaperonin GroES (HSP10)